MLNFSQSNPLSLVHSLLFCESECTSGKSKHFQKCRIPISDWINTINAFFHSFLSPLWYCTRLNDLLNIYHVAGNCFLKPFQAICCFAKSYCFYSMKTLASEDAESNHKAPRIIFQSVAIFIQKKHIFLVRKNISLYRIHNKALCSL